MMTKTPPPTDKSQSDCCSSDPYADLPPELRPKNKTWKSSLRKVTCPGCGVEFWTNSEKKLCPDCRKNGVQIPQKEKEK